MSSKSQYKCQKCSFISPKWLGKCPECSSWNSFSEQQVVKNTKASGFRPSAPTAVFTPASSVSKNITKMIPTGDSEIDSVLGGGLVSSGVYLLSGDPGVGKSTLALQISAHLAAKKNSVFYVSGEETADQISARLHRFKPSPAALGNINLMSEIRLESILTTLIEQKPAFVIFDSIQTFASLDIDSSSGSQSQVREVCSQIVDYAKQQGIPVLIIGHITKSGDLAGPKFLEHMVDTVLFLEGSRDHSFRLLRFLKNRFGSTDETGVFQMEDAGLTPIKNPSEFLLKDRAAGTSGAVITTVMEGNRPLLVEIQALVSRSGFGYPRRTASGFDLTRTQLIVGVLQKHAGLQIENQDIFINVVGGFRVKDRACDLAVALAIASSLLDKQLPPDLVVFGELGLSGEIRSVPNSDKRIKESQKLGFAKILGPSGLKKASGVYPLSNISEAVNRLKEI